VKQKTLGEIASSCLGSWDQVAAAVVAEHERRQWQPIATAPKGKECFVGMLKRGEWRSKATSFVQLAIEDGYTHWRPMPECQEVDQ
jgi:hypothetical protein